jgi:hypothetical protein
VCVVVGFYGLVMDELSWFLLCWLLVFPKIISVEQPPYLSAWSLCVFESVRSCVLFGDAAGRLCRCVSVHCFGFGCFCSFFGG